LRDKEARAEFSSLRGRSGTLPRRAFSLLELAPVVAGRVKGRSL
jgi:hypothetical protein